MKTCVGDVVKLVHATHFKDLNKVGVVQSIENNGDIYILVRLEDDHHRIVWELEEVVRHAIDEILNLFK